MTLDKSPDASETQPSPITRSIIFLREEEQRPALSMRLRSSLVQYQISQTGGRQPEEFAWPPNNRGQGTRGGRD